MIEILAGGLGASVQDLGRIGHRHLGVGQSGALDAVALQVGNLLVGNPVGLAAVEFTLGGFAVRFLSDTVFALTGADAGARLDGEPVPAWWLRRARAGQELRAGMAERGMRSVLCVAGGIDVPQVMGSRSTDLKGGFGGYAGRLLQEGDRLGLGAPVAPPAVSLRGFGLDAVGLGLVPAAADPAVVRFLPAAEWAELAPATRAAFLSQSWRLRPDSNRMGYRFAGDALQFPGRELLSHGILPGTIQLPPDGQPVIQLNDANTCGGYPKLGVVIAADMPRLAQLRLGAGLRFEEVGRAEALAAADRVRALCEKLPGRIALAADYARRRGLE